jgi:thioester reductase-like protein
MITQFYLDKTILITGSTGFLGKVVLEKILRSLPVVKRIYLAITPKAAEGKSEFSRYQEEIMES